MEIPVEVNKKFAMWPILKFPQGLEQNLKFSLCVKLICFSVETTAKVYIYLVEIWCIIIFEPKMQIPSLCTLSPSL